MKDSDASDTEDYNPFQAPGVNVVDEAQFGKDSERIRRTHLNHETSAKAIGGLYVTVGAFCVLLLGFSMYIANLHGGAVPMFAVVLLTFPGLLGLLLGLGLINLKRWARVPSIILAIVGVFAVPIGTVICGYYLFQMSGEKGKMIFSDEYREVIDQTPHIKYGQDGLDHRFLAICLGSILVILLLIAVWAA